MHHLAYQALLCNTGEGAGGYRNEASVYICTLGVPVKGFH